MNIKVSALLVKFFEVNWSFYQASFYNNITGNFNVVPFDLLLLNVLIVFSASLRKNEIFVAK